MKGFIEHGKFGNLPYGFRANTWLVSPSIAESPLNSHLYQQKMKIGVAMAEPKEEMENWTYDRGNLVGDWSITVKHDRADASLKSEVKINGNLSSSMCAEEVARRNLLKGVTADESVVVHCSFWQYTSSLGTVIVRQFGYTTVAKDVADVKKDILRVPLHKSFAAELPGGGQSPQSNLDDSEPFRPLVRRVIKQSLTKLEGEPTASERSIRWELGSCWVQQLQKQETPMDKNSGSSGADNEAEHAVKGLGKQFKFLKKRDNKPNSVGSINEKNEVDNEPWSMNLGTNVRQEDNGELKSEMGLKKLISKEAFLCLKETGTGLHSKTVDELI
ncbi:Tetratricopeptide repeat (TPR)-like superfamily protein [Melia azedarach]|uniref:Tetratricopeptide repeat (TPR)-like superfamily protein n=1 Tax=Melia azedarach TaxID=155640 RepID=A0ACC1Y446_MELAZ|nr:Tetratricopeptide repeat (TPR)-like superfamily protein [Melia azedarach]